MFTGIIETLGTVAAVGGGRLLVRPRGSFQTVREGESVSVDGVCLTVERQIGAALEFRLLKETLRASALGGLRAGFRVNLERALRLGDRLGGHLLLGHVDGVGVIAARARAGPNQSVDIDVPAPLARALVPKGPIGVDGISLTLDPALRADAGGVRRRVRVHLIPRTARATTLGGKPVGAKVNLELDVVVKYLRGML